MLDCGTNECGDQLVSGSVLTPKNHVEIIEVMVVVVVVVVVIVIVTVTFVKCSL
jgi:hypothetical protein